MKGNAVPDSDLDLTIVLWGVDKKEQFPNIRQFDWVLIQTANVAIKQSRLLNNRPCPIICDLGLFVINAEDVISFLESADGRDSRLVGLGYEYQVAALFMPFVYLSDPEALMELRRSVVRKIQEELATPASGDIPSPWFAVWPSISGAWTESMLPNPTKSRMRPLPPGRELYLSLPTLDELSSEFQPSSLEARGLTQPQTGRNSRQNSRDTLPNSGPGNGSTAQLGGAFAGAELLMASMPTGLDSNFNSLDPASSFIPQIDAWLKLLNNSPPVEILGISINLLPLPLGNRY